MSNRVRSEADDGEFSEGLPRSQEFMRVWNRTATLRDIGRRLEQMRADKGYTQAQLAERMKKDQAFVARMESGRGDMPKAENIALFAESCGYATAYAFVNIDADDHLNLREMQPIGHSSIAGELRAVRNVELQVEASCALDD